MPFPFLFIIIKTTLIQYKSVRWNPHAVQRVACNDGSAGESLYSDPMSGRQEAYHATYLLWAQLKSPAHKKRSFTRMPSDAKPIDSICKSPLNDTGNWRRQWLQPPEQYSMCSTLVKHHHHEIKTVNSKKHAWPPALYQYEQPYATNGRTKTVIAVDEEVGLSIRTSTPSI